jgi:hypothetical protein
LFSACADNAKTDGGKRPRAAMIWESSAKGVSMKLTKKILGIAVIIAVIGFLSLPLTGCPQEADDDGSTNNSTTTTKPDDGKTQGVKTLKSIAVTTTKTEYNLNEEFDKTSIIVTATYSDGSTEAITTGYVIGNEFNSSTKGNKEITVTYQGKTATFSVNVIDPTKPTVAKPTASPAGGEVASGTLVTLTTATNDAEVWYTTNGNIPAKNVSGSTKYTAPFAITPPVIIKAIAFKNDMNDSDELTAEYPATQISVANINIDAPTKGAVPAAAVSNPDQERFTAGTVTWSPTDNPFKPNTEYTASVILTAKSGFTFLGSPELGAHINEASAVITNKEDKTVTLSHKFEATGEKAILGIEIATQPTSPKLTFTHGDTLNLNLSGLKVKLTYDDGTTQEVAYENFGEANGITTVPSEGIALEHKTYEGKPVPVTINCAKFTVSIGNLTVDRKSFSDTTNVIVDDIADQFYEGSALTPALTIKHHVENSTRTLQLGEDYEAVYNNNDSEGDATVTITGIGDYTGTRIVTFKIKIETPPIITTNTLPNGTVGTAYSQTTLTAAGDTPITWSIESGALPTGLELSNAAGVISGTPTTAGTFTFTVKATNTVGNNTKSLSITIETDESSFTTFNSIADFKTWLELPEQTANSAANPYKIKLNVSDLGGDRNASGSVGNALYTNTTKYVYLDLFGSNFTSIPAGAFNGCTNLSGIIIPNTVTSIGNVAFGGCTSLTAINVDSTNSAYSSQDGVLYNKDKTSLIQYPMGKTDSTFTIPNGVTSIGNFQRITSLTSITIPNTVTSIGSFSSCTGLTSITIPDSVTNSIGNQYFYGCTSLTSVTIGNGVTSIGNQAFQGCTSLTSVTIGNGVTSIGTQAFSGCTGLTSVTIGSGLTSIANINFSDFTKLTAINVDSANSEYSSQDGILYNKAKTQIVFVPKGITGAITIPNTVTSIPNSAFSGCTGLTGITIGNGVTSIGDYAFNGCTVLTGITIGSGVTSIASNAFNNCNGLTGINVDSANSAYSSQDDILYNKAKTQIVFVPKGKTGAVTIPNTVTSIPSSAFSGCTGLTSVTIPDSVTSIGGSAFSGCTGLTSVTIPDGVTSIGSSAFNGCTSLASIIVPDSVASIGNNAFAGTQWFNNQPDGLVYAGKVAYKYKGTMDSGYITLLDGTKGITDEAFKAYTDLRSVTIPDGVTNIGNSAFENCVNLMLVNIPNIKDIAENT